MSRRWLEVALSAVAVCAVGLAAPAPDVIEVDILTLTSIDWQPGDELPKRIRDLDGREVAMTGYMQSQLRRDTRRFSIVGDSCQCTRTPLPHHFIEVTLDEKTGYRPGQLSFIGTLSVGEVVEDGFVTSLYRLDGRFL